MAISVFFRLLHHKIESLPKNLSANVYDRTYVVFNPYPAKTKVIHNFLTALPVFTLLISVIIVITVWRIFMSGFVLSLATIIIGLNLLVVEDALEIYMNSKMFLQSVNKEINLGVGDLKGLQILRKILPKITYYYFALSIVFLVSSFALFFAWGFILWAFTEFIGFTFQISTLTGLMSYQVVVILFVLEIIIIQLLVSKAKQKLVGWGRTSRIS